MLFLFWIGASFSTDSNSQSCIQRKLPEWWPANPINLGLDLRGGSYLVLGVKTEEAVHSQLANIAASVRSEIRKEKIAKVMRAKARRATRCSLPCWETRDLQLERLHEKGIP